MSVVSARLLAAVTLLTLGSAACGGGGESPTAPPNGGIAAAHLGTAGAIIAATGQNTFEPAMQRVTVGEIVEWKNTGAILHDIVFSNNTSTAEIYADSEPALRDAALVPGGVWQVKFTTTGTFAYLRTLHPGMVATIVVT
jgi:plastocyanin